MIFVTVDYFDRRWKALPPSCEGCSPPPPAKTPTSPAVLRVVGASGGLSLCTRCAVDTIKSIAARFVMFDRKSTRDLMDFFAAEAAKPRRPRRRPPRAKALPGAVVLPKGARVPPRRDP